MKLLTFFISILIPVFLHGQTISTIAGTGSSVATGDGGPATAAGTPNPAGGEFDKYGNYFFADGASNRIRKISPLGTISTVAGNGVGGYLSDGVLATNTRLYNPICVALDTIGNLYIADAANHRVRKVNAITNLISTFAGTGNPAFSGDGGPATSADLFGIQSICLDKNGNVYIADGFNYRIRKVNTSGIITTFVGTGVPGYSGEGTLADTSMVGLVAGMCTDTNGNLYFTNNSISLRVMKVNTSGILQTVAGTGLGSYSGDGIPATNANIGPVAVAIDSFNNLFIADKVNRRIFKVEAVTGIIYSVAGDGTLGDAGDGGPATTASLYSPVDVALDACGNLYIPTIGGTTIGTGRRIRKVDFNPTCTIPSLTTNSPLLEPCEVKIFPNPAATELNLTATNKITEVCLYNIVGQAVYSQVCFTNSLTLPLRHLHPGVYVVRVTDSGGNTTVHKVTKE